jgi:predicted O-methyltransferase YrrM
VDNNPPKEWNSEPEVGWFLAGLIAMTGAKTVLEVGVFEGETSIALINALPKDGYFAGIDIEDFRTADAKKAYSAKGKSIDFILGDSILELPKLTRNHFGLVFVDSAHHWEHILPEFKQVEHVLTPGGLIVYHDGIHMPDVVRLMDYAEQYDYSKITLNTPEKRGLTILKRK